MSGWWQRLRAGDRSTVIQAQNVAISTNVTYSDVRDISKDVVQHEMEKFSSTAIEIFSQRFEEFVLNYYTRQATIAPEGLNSLNDPFMQRALRTAHVEYGASGNADTGEMLADLLVTLSTYEPQRFQAICLNEALSVVPKLRKNQIAALTALLITSGVQLSAGFLADYYKLLRDHLAPLSTLVPDDRLSYRHMQFAQVGWMNTSKIRSFGGMIQNTLPGLFTEGILQADVPEPLRVNPPIWVKHERYNERVRINAPNYAAIDALANAHPVIVPWVSNLKEQMRRALTKPEDIEKQIITEIPEMERLIRIWNNAELGYFELTSIGIVIGHANWKQMGTGPIVDLDSAFPSSDA